MRSLATCLAQRTVVTLAVGFVLIASRESTYASCGDGILESPVESCDDANTEDGDCCLSTCELEAEGAVCNASDLCFSRAAATCDSIGTCVARDFCSPGGLPWFYALSLLDDDNRTSERLTWWKGDLTDEYSALFGDPTTHTRYAFCLYNTTDFLVLQPEGTVALSIKVAPGPQWRKPKDGPDWKFRGDANTPGGVRRMTLGGRKGRFGGSSARLHARALNGIGLPGPDSADRYFESHVVFGLVNDEGLCLLSDLHGVAIKNDSPTQFRARITFRD